MQPRIYVDFNEMPSSNEVLLAQGDSKLDSEGNVVEFFAGKAIAVYMNDVGEDGERDNLLADGVVVQNTHGGWTSAAKWMLKIDDRGIRRESAEVER